MKDISKDVPKDLNQENAETRKRHQNEVSIWMNYFLKFFYLLISNFFKSMKWEKFKLNWTECWIFVNVLCFQIFQTIAIFFFNTARNWLKIKNPAARRQICISLKMLINFHLILKILKLGSVISIRNLFWVYYLKVLKYFYVLNHWKRYEKFSAQNHICWIWFWVSARYFSLKNFII